MRPVDGDVVVADDAQDLKFRPVHVADYAFAGSRPRGRVSEGGYNGRGQREKYHTKTSIHAGCGIVSWISRGRRYSGMAS